MEPSQDSKDRLMIYMSRSLWVGLWVEWQGGLVMYPTLLLDVDEFKG